MSLRVLDPRRLAPVPMSGIRGHWSGGGHRANATDRKHYHTLTEGDGKIVYGVDIALNSGGTRPGYAAHTRANNTNNIGHTMCGMLGAREAPFHPGTQPLTLPQWNQFVLATADLAEFYKIAVAWDKILFHAEVQPSLGIAQNGKWDVVVLPFDTSVRGARQIGDRWRDEVLSALRGNGPSEPLPQPEPLPAGFEGGTAVTTAPRLNFRSGPGASHATIGGGLPPGVVLTVLAAEGPWLNVRTPNGHKGWVHGGYVRMLDTGPSESTGSVPDPLHAEFSTIRNRLDSLEADMPTDRERLARALQAVRAQLDGV